jgi:hypothetical protein
MIRAAEAEERRDEAAPLGTQYLPNWAQIAMCNSLIDEVLRTADEMGWRVQPETEEQSMDEGQAS